MMGNLTPIPHRRFLGHNRSVEIGLIELTELSDELNNNPPFKHCFLQTILHVFLLFIFVWYKIICSKN